MAIAEMENSEPAAIFGVLLVDWPLASAEAPEVTVKPSGRIAKLSIEQRALLPEVRRTRTSGAAVVEAFESDGFSPGVLVCVGEGRRGRRAVEGGGSAHAGSRIFLVDEIHRDRACDPGSEYFFRGVQSEHVQRKIPLCDLGIETGSRSLSGFNGIQRVVRESNRRRFCESDRVRRIGGRVGDCLRRAVGD